MSIESDVRTEVPDDLKKLVRYVMRGFYQIEHAITMDILIHHPCIKEDDILDLLKFERKQLRAVINTLKTDKFIKSRMRVETDSEGKTTRHNYYFINYSVFVNVVKYKLDHMLKKLEMQEREATNRASYQCPQCQKTFTDLEADQLFDPMSGNFLCTYCQSEVEEEASNAPKSDAQSLMVTFNDQMTSLYTLLKALEDVKLSREILEPEPCDLKPKFVFCLLKMKGIVVTAHRLYPTYIMQHLFVTLFSCDGLCILLLYVRSDGRPRPAGDRTTWSGDATKNRDYGLYNYNKVYIVHADAWWRLAIKYAGFSFDDDNDRCPDYGVYLLCLG